MSIMRSFKKNQKGSVMSLFVLTFIPVMALFGSVVDYVRASSERTRLQSAVDNIALNLVREAPFLTPTQLQQKATQALSGAFQPQHGGSATITATRQNENVHIIANANVQTVVMKAFRIPSLAIRSEAKAAWGSKTIELALVLDNTGSMSRLNKMDELKKASHTLLDALQNASGGGARVKVSVVPFDTQVRLDAGLRHSSWLSPLVAGEPGRGNWLKTLPRQGTDPDLYARNSWEGYVTDRALQMRDPVTSQIRNVDMNVKDDAPDSFKSWTTYPMVRNEEGSHLASLQPLSSNLSRGGPLRTTIDGMRPRGCTNITIGAMWGLETLSNVQPFSEGVTYGTEKVEKIMILLTDGWNTRDSFSNTCGHSEGNTEIDARTAAACEMVKSKGIILYTIKVVEGSDTLLKACASRITDPQSVYYKSGKELYYPVKDASQLTAVFQGIAGQILETRITQ
jgi:Flp pilus assembly protein TadG